MFFLTFPVFGFHKTAGDTEDFATNGCNQGLALKTGLLVVIHVFTFPQSAREQNTLWLFVQKEITLTVPSY